jgi:hypothetical protein
MGKLIAIAIVLGLAYLLLTNAQDWLGGSSGSSRGAISAEGQASEACIEAVEYANDVFAEELRQYSRPPINPDAWSDTMSSVEGLIGAAENSCFCSTPACIKASEALGELRSLVFDFDSLASGSVSGWSNPGTKQETIQRILREAEALIEA